MIPAQCDILTAESQEDTGRQYGADDTALVVDDEILDLANLLASPAVFDSLSDDIVGVKRTSRPADHAGTLLFEMLIAGMLFTGTLLTEWIQVVLFIRHDGCAQCQRRDNGCGKDQCH